MIVPTFLAGNIFFVLLHGWVDRRLRIDRSIHDRLHIDVSDESFGWVIAPGPPHRLPWLPLSGTASAAVVLTMAETALFVVVSDVPRFWYESGAIASFVAAALPFILAGVFRSALGRRIDQMVAQQANIGFAFALPVLFAAGQIDRECDALYASLALRRRADASERCRRILFEHAGAQPDAALPALESIRSCAERDLRNLKWLVTEVQAGTTLLERVKARPGHAQSLVGEGARVEEAIHSEALWNALEAGQWPDAALVIERIRPDLDKLAATVGADPGVPKSAEDAYRVLNVREDTPLDSIKTILSAYRRIWHPDRARDDSERVLFTLKMQQLNVAWDLIQEARGLIRRDADKPKVE